MNDRAINPDGEFVLYWMIAFRRLDWNFALEHAVNHARTLGKPLLVFEPLRSDYPWASERLHRFVLDGMRHHASRLETGRVGYYPYVERERGQGRGLLGALAARAALIVSDDYPAFFIPRMLEAAAERVPVRLEAIDSNGLLPLGVTGKAFARAFDFRRLLQRELPDYFDAFPKPHPLVGAPLPSFEGSAIPADISGRWPPVNEGLLDPTASLSEFPIDHGVAPVDYRGGGDAAGKVLQRFLDSCLGRYTDRNDPAESVTSELSPYLHFGHIASHQVFHKLMQREEWRPDRVAQESSGGRSGWWNVREAAEAFLDQLVTWRELGFHTCRYDPDYAKYASLPDWARDTLAEHAGDRREYVYDLEQFGAAETHDDLWNAAQRELVQEGRIHNYLRMLWGKKILEWTADPEEAFAIMVELNNRHAVDGRDPNSYSGISWVLGRYDRPWGPERRVFGKVRYMTSANTARKYNVTPYLARFAPDPG